MYRIPIIVAIMGIALIIVGCIGIGLASQGYSVQARSIAPCLQVAGFLGALLFVGSLIACVIIAVHYGNNSRN